MVADISFVLDHSHTLNLTRCEDMVQAAHRGKFINPAIARAPLWGGAKNESQLNVGENSGDS
eukprot:COSAG04_NODE_9089_length_900_cov_0.876404_2_plen_61_part_01